MRVWVGILVVFIVQHMSSDAAVLSVYGGNYSSWPDSWTSLTSLNDPDDGVTAELDFVGDSSNAGAYFAMDDNYIYFRIRMDIGSVTAATYRDSVGIMIDQAGVGTAGRPDYAFMWDSKGEETNPGEHGLEMTELDTLGNSWNLTKFDDVDGSASKKFAPPDFSTSLGDGYIRLVDGQATVNFGDTTFIDYAVSWSYLVNKSGTTLNTNQTWYIQLGSINNATDHNNISTDIAGGYSPASLVTSSWSDPIYTDPSGPEDQVPEPMSITLAGISILMLYATRKVWGRNTTHTHNKEPL